jgi:hypothetical protein
MVLTDWGGKFPKRQGDSGRFSKCLVTSITNNGGIIEYKRLFWMIC